MFCLDPEVGKYYEIAEYTRKTGTWGNEMKDTLQRMYHVM
jgi:hypothetical protein